MRQVGWLTKLIMVGAVSAAPVILSTIQASAQGSGHVSQNCPDLEVTGIESRAKLEPFFKQVKEAVSSGDATAVADMIEFPIFAKVGGHRILIANKNVFLKHADEILTDKVKAAAHDQKFSEVFCNYQGVMFGEGEIWLTQIKPKKGKARLRIKAINN